MATWTSATGEPVTVEREVRVRNVETDEEGYVGLSFENRTRSPRFYGPVYTVERTYDKDGAEVADPTKTVIDANPTFA